MLRYILARLVATVPVLAIISLLAFVLEAMTPGDPAVLLLQARGVDVITPAVLSAERAELHLDRPLPQRYFDWLRDAAHGDFGRSLRSSTPVLTLYRQTIGNTLLLAICASAVAAVVGIPLGAFAATRQGDVPDRLARGFAAFAAAVPGFWLAFALIFLFSVSLHWLPALGTPSLRGIILPAAVLAFSHLAVLTRLTRSVVADVMSQEFVTVARAKGLSGLTLIVRHMLPHAVAPILTVLGLETAYLMTGAAVVEYVFGWPGIGRMAVEAALLRDTPVVVGFALAAGLIFVSMNLVVDITVALLDPRVGHV